MNTVWHKVGYRVNGHSFWRYEDAFTYAAGLYWETGVIHQIQWNGDER